MIWAYPRNLVLPVVITVPPLPVQLGLLFVQNAVTGIWMPVEPVSNVKFVTVAVPTPRLICGGLLVLASD